MVAPSLYILTTYSYDAVPRLYLSLRRFRVTHCANNGIDELLEEVDDQLEFCRQHNWQISWLHALRI